MSVDSREVEYLACGLVLQMEREDGLSSAVLFMVENPENEVWVENFGGGWDGLAFRSPKSLAAKFLSGASLNLMDASKEELESFGGFSELVSVESHVE